jgi:prepilin-type N-terminal cleavage/methylation domain-containing protein
MKPLRCRRATGGFTLLELVVVVAVIGLLGLVAVDRLLYVREQAEKAVMEENIAMFKAALRLQIADRMARQQTAAIAALAGRNPVDWLEDPPANYRGEFAAGQAPDCRGCWYFDTTARALVYEVDRGAYFQADERGRKRVRLRVEAVLPQAQGAKADETAIPSVKLVLLEPYRWF